MCTTWAPHCTRYVLFPSLSPSLILLSVSPSLALCQSRLFIICCAFLSACHEKEVKQIFFFFGFVVFLYFLLYFLGVCVCCLTCCCCCCCGVEIPARVCLCNTHICHGFCSCGGAATRRYKCHSLVAACSSMHSPHTQFTIHNPQLTRRTDCTTSRRRRRQLKLERLQIS